MKLSNILAAVLLLAASASAEPLRITATVGMVADVVRNIAGERAQVTTLMGEGVDPHLYKPTRADIAALTSSDMVFYNGLLLEGKMTDALIRVASSGKMVHAVTELLDDSALLEPDEFQGHHDPHVWMDPTLWAGTVRAVERKLIERDPEGTSVYEMNASDYAARLDALASYAASSLASIPERQRVLITAHDAFNYFGRRFNLDVVGIQGISTESEAGVKDIQRLVDLIVERRIAAVFVESTVSARNIEALIEGARAKGHTVTIGGQLYSDAMGKAGTYEGTYIGMIDHNVTVITRALGGTAPERGMSGLLTLP